MTKRAMTKLATTSPGPTLEPVSEASLEALEFPQLLAVVSVLAATDLGRQRILRLAPFSQEEELRLHHRLVEEAGRLLQGGRLIPAFEEPLVSTLERLVSDRPPIAGPELVVLAALIRAVDELKGRIAEADPPCPELGKRITALPRLSELSQRIGKCLDRRGEVREDASPLLRRLRQRIQQVRDGLYRDLRAYVQEHRDHLSEETVPLRDGRLVLTLQAGARGKLSGLTHGRSGTGKSFYFEPLAAVENNNRLQQAVEDEAAEKQRIIIELVAAAREAMAELRQYAELLEQMDFLQATHRFAQLCDGHWPEIGPRHQLRLVAAYHPLLDPRLAGLREEALYTAGHRGEVTPLDLSFSADERTLVVTGPNAGGKTVALKTAGLLALAVLCGLPIPAARGTRIPFFSNLVATVGDEQDLLADRSTFSGRLLRLKEAWLGAGPDSLILLDELGSGTDPEEGAALSVSLLEALLERGSLALMTSHLVQVAAAALELPGATCAAMEFDRETGSPTFRLVPGPPGGSEAIALARRLGLPEPWLRRAEQRLGADHRDLRRMLQEVERLRLSLAEERENLSQETADAARLRERLAGQEEALRRERKELTTSLKRQLEEFRRQTVQRMRTEMDRFQEQLAASRPRQAVEKEAIRALFEQAPSFDAGSEGGEDEDLPLEVGVAVRHRTLGWVGTLEKLDRGRAEVSTQGKKLRCRQEELVATGRPQPPGPKRPRRAATVRPAAGPGLANDEPRELNLIGQRVEEALHNLDSFLDRALLGGPPEVRVVHGHGSGRLREAVRSHLRRHPAIRDFRPGGDGEGGNGATVASLGSTP
jgi:DNA mismatch repair protein MutS2